jgi:hypothetical protein
VNTASFASSSQGGHQDYQVNASVTLPDEAGRTIEAHLRMVDGSYRSGSLRGSNLSIPLAGGVFLQRLGVALDPPTELSSWRIDGDAGVSYGPAVKGTTLIEVAGRLSYTFPGPHGHYGLYELSGSLRMAGALIGSADLSVGDAPATFRVVLGPGDGSRGLELGTYAHVTGVLSGSISTKGFSLEGATTAEIAGFRVGAELYANQQGMAFCADLHLTKAGVKWLWSGRPELMGSSCSTRGF